MNGWRQTLRDFIREKRLFGRNSNAEKDLIAFIEQVESQAKEEGRKMKGSSWREGYEQGKREEQEKIIKGVEDYKIPKEATRLNKLGADYIFVYDLKLLLTNLRDKI